MSGTDNIDNIVSFFLNLYRIQSGVESLDPELVAYNPIQSGNDTGEKRYELKVNRDGKWRTRRMTVAPLGEGTASKSACYKVVYDDIMVIKIPPNPIRSFPDYLKAVRAEQKIGRRLSPDVPCLSPNLEAILTKLPHFRQLGEEQNTDIEKTLISKVKSAPGLQSHLKIGNTFVLFMSLSQHAFFGDVMEALQNKEGQIKSEILHGMDATEDIHAFESRYGEGLDELFFSLNDLVRKFELNLGKLMTLQGFDDIDIPEFKRRKWFFQRLADKPLEIDLSKFGQDFVEEIEKLLARLFETEKEIIERYREMIRSRISAKTYSRNIAIAKSVIVNLLKLLNDLKDKGVALRDMKPENMFLIGESDNPENYLRNPAQFRIGLIDLETCAIIENEKESEQPLLAGTPEYATPAHLFENEVLAAVYPDLKRIVMLQDWHATLGIIYRTIVARPLFEKTAPLFQEIIRAKEKALKKHIPPADILKNTSWIFWTSAVEEFNDNICGRTSILKSTSVSLDRVEASMLAEQITLEKEKSKELLKNKVDSQPFFKNPQTKKDLLKATVPALITLAKLGMKGKNAQKLSPQIQRKMARFFKDLIALKTKMADQQRFLKMLYEDYKAISVYDLLAIMFTIVFSAMYDPAADETRQAPEIKVGE